MRETMKNDMQKKIDDAGFLLDFEDWTEDVARAIAAREGIVGLSGHQLDILNYLRTYFRKNTFFPILRSICANVHQPRTCVTDNFNDPVVAWKIAGLPNPGEEVMGFRSWEPLGF